MTDCIVMANAKREIPTPLKKILSIDVAVTNIFCQWANQFLPLRSLRNHYKMLEISCHGIPWLAGWLAFIWLWNEPSLHQMEVNFFIGLLIDIVLVALIKAFTRRRRPQANNPDMFATVGPDKFSFPSGHASRACMIAHFFIFVWPVPFLFTMPLLAWATSVCISRILLQRHHILDVFAGSLLGVLESLIVSFLWLSPETSSWVITYLSDEKLDGGSYHV